MSITTQERILDIIGVIGGLAAVSITFASMELEALTAMLERLSE